MKKIARAVILFFAAVLLCLPLCGCKIYEPTIKEGEFPFVLEYEMDGEHYLVEDTLIYKYDGHDPSMASFISWDCSTKSGEYSYMTAFRFFYKKPSYIDKDRIVMEAKVKINLNNGGYYMGDPRYADWSPEFRYEERYYTSSGYDEHSDSMVLTVEQMEEIFGVKIIRLEISEPIENEYIEINTYP